MSAGITIGFNISVAEVEKGSPVTVCADSYSENQVEVNKDPINLLVKTREGTAGKQLWLNECHKS